MDQLVLHALRSHCPESLTDGELIGTLVRRVEVGPELITVRLATGAPDAAPSEDPDSEASDDAVLTIPWRRSRSARHREVIVALDRHAPARPMRVETRATLLQAIAKGRVWLGEIMTGAAESPDIIAAREGCSRRQVNATISLAHLAPDIVEAAIQGRLPHGIALRDLTDPPLAWSEQRDLIGWST